MPWSGREKEQSAAVAAASEARNRLSDGADVWEGGGAAHLWEGVHGAIAGLHAVALEASKAFGQLGRTPAQRGQDRALLLQAGHTQGEETRGSGEAVAYLYH